MTKTDAIKNALKKRVGKVVPPTFPSNNKTKAAALKVVIKKRYA